MKTAAFLAILALSGCALETPKAYVALGNTGYSAYVYGGFGVARMDNTDAPQ